MILSIITVTYNNADGLRRTLQSVASQSFRQFEQIVVDGKSTDESKDVIRAFSDSFAEYKWISEEDKGIYDAMNKGIRMAEGEYCLFLNAGDILANDSVLEELMSNELTADIVSCNAVLEESRFHAEQYSISPETIKASDLILRNLPHQATLIRRYLFSAIHEYDISFRVVSDWLFFIEAILKYNASYQHIQMFLSRCETEGISSNPSNNSMMEEEFHRGLNKALPLFYNDYADLRSKLNNLQSEHVRFVEKLGESVLGVVLWRLRTVLNRIGYYKWKKSIRIKRFYRQLRKEDNNKKKAVAKQIDLLPYNVLKRENNERDFIVSLTSYGKRVKDSAPYAIYSMLTQTHLPDRIVLWLDKEHWNNGNLPYLLQRLQLSGVEIYYYEDIRSYKKLIPSLEMFPNNPIIVIDDDFYYNKDFVKWMIDAYENSDKQTVFATWGCIPEKVNGEYIPYSKWKDCKYGNEHSEYSLFGGGSIYPPHIFDDEVRRKDLFMNMCPSADDLWFWVQEKRLGVKTQLTEHHGYGLHIPVNRIEEYDLTQRGTLFYVNCIQGKNDEQLDALLKHYFRT